MVGLDMMVEGQADMRAASAATAVSGLSEIERLMRSQPLNPLSRLDVEVISNRQENSEDESD